MNCMGPTAWSNSWSWSHRPPSVSLTSANFSPVRGGPMMGFSVDPSVRRPPPMAAWSDSTLPMPAMSSQGTLHCGHCSRASFSAFL